MIDGREKFRRDCAWWAFRRVSKLALFRWQVMAKDIEAVWMSMEEKYFTDQEEVEAEALALYKKNPKKAIKYLTKYSLDTANGAVDAYWKLGDDLWSKFNNYF